jgi:O-antigen/teichoic acid export membrane protein
MFFNRNTLIQTTRLNAIFAFVFRAASAGSGLLIGALLARLLSIEMVGAYFVLLHLIRVSGVITRVGLSDNTMRQLAIAADHNKLDVIASHIKISIFVISFVYSVLSLIYILFWPEIAETLNLTLPKGIIWIFMICIAFRASEDHLTFILKGLHHVKASIALLNSPRQLISAIFLISIWIIGLQFTLKGAFLLYLLASIPSFILATSLILKLSCFRSIQQKNLPIVSLLKSSLPFFGMNLLSILMASVPLWLVSGLVGKAEAGLYGAAIQLTFLISFFLGVSNQITPPALAALFASNEKKPLEMILRKTAGWGLMLSTPAVVMLLFFGKFILSLVYGPAFEEAAIVLAFLTIGQFVNTAAGSPGMMLQMSGKQSSLLAITSFWMFLNLVGGISLAPTWGMNGIAAAHCLGLVGQNLTMVLLVRRQIGVRTYAQLDFERLLYSKHKLND